MVTFNVTIIVALWPPNLQESCPDFPQKFLAKTLLLTPSRNARNGKIKGTRSCVGIFDAGRKDIRCFSTPSRRQASCHASKGLKRPRKIPRHACVLIPFLRWAAWEHFSCHLRNLFVSSIQNCVHVWFVRDVKLPSRCAYSPR